MSESAELRNALRRIEQLEITIRRISQVESKPRLILAEDVKVFRTPGGGIAARSGSSLGSASCTIVTVTGGSRTVTASSETVYNDFLTSITGSVDIIATKINGVWVVFAEDCT